MPITAKFIADFASFKDAVTAAEVSLRGFETGAGKVETALNRMADSFSGRKIISDAELAVRAVTDIGGASKLTENEQRKLNTTLTEAIAKYSVLGQSAPADMVRLADATRQANGIIGQIPPSLKGILSALSPLAGAFGVAFSVGAVVNFGKSVFDSASKIHDLSEQLGISAEAVQGFQFAAEQSGSTLDAVGTAITKMNNNLSEGGKGTIQALRDAGLEFATIRNMKPEDAFLAITDAIQQIPDPMKQSEVALQLFGRGAAELLPGIKEGFRGVADSASKMSTDTINSLEAAQDAWGKLADKVTIITGSIIAETMRLTSSVTSSWKNFLMFADNVMQHGIGQAAAMADLTAEAQKAAPAIQQTAAAVGALGVAHEKTTTSTKAHAAAVEKVRSMYDLMTHDAVHDISTVADSVDKLAGKFQGELAEAIVPSIPLIASLGSAWGKIGTQIDIVPPKIAKTKDSLDELSRSMAQLAQISGDAFGSVVRGLSTMVGGLDSALKAGAALNQGFKILASGETMAGLAGIASGLAGIAAAGVQVGISLRPLLGLHHGLLGKLLGTNTEGRTAVIDFAETFGGFDALHEKLLMLGDAGEALWIKLTQGVGRSNPEQAQAVIDEITRKLHEQEQQQQGTTAATEEQAQATIETATQAALALDELGVRLKTNEQEWAEWSEKVTGYIRDLAAGVRGITLPTPPGGSSGGGGDQLTMSGGGRGGGRPIVVQSVIDGRVVAESTMRHLPAAAQLYGVR